MEHQPQSGKNDSPEENKAEERKRIIEEALEKIKRIEQKKDKDVIELEALITRTLSLPNTKISKKVSERIKEQLAREKVNLENSAEIETKEVKKTLNHKLRQLGRRLGPLEEDSLRLTKPGADTEIDAELRNIGEHLMKDGWDPTKD